MQRDIYSLDGVYFALCKAVDSAVALGSWIRFKEGNHLENAIQEIYPRDYQDYRSFSLDYAVVSFLSKWKGLTTGLDLEREALTRFTTAEASCRETNFRFKKCAITTSKSWIYSILHGASRKIAKLLGSVDLSRVEDGYGWGPGATLEISRRRSFVDTKMCELPITVSLSARALLAKTIQADLQWSDTLLGTRPEGPYSLLKSCFTLSESSRIETVPKNAKTHRIIAVEPRGNAFLQKGVGDVIRDRLRRVGVNLSDQGRNQRLAQQALRKGLATLDLKAASDTVSRELVWSLFPYEWASLMDALRTRKAEMPDGSTIVLEKFSSMGNGFTFELESCIFWALCASVYDFLGLKGEELAIYGDDLIVSAKAVTELSLVLQFCGFEVNDQKSFISGLFYESCGKHFFNEKDVTPCYQKSVLDSELELIRCHNRLMRLAFRLSGGRCLDKVLWGAISALRRMSRTSRTHCIPFGVEGDDGWLVEYSAFPFRRSNPNEGVKCAIFKKVPIRFPVNEKAALSWSFRRGIATETPFAGYISGGRDDTPIISSSRWVHPTGEFSVLWG